MGKTWKAALYLENGQTWVGAGFGAPVEKGGELVFNTGMMGYQEVLSDPSYDRQVVLLTASHIGNTGVNALDQESKGVAHLGGVVVRAYEAEPSSWRSERTLGALLESEGVPGIEGIDTRSVVRVLRDHGSQRAVVFPVPEGQKDPRGWAQAHGRKAVEKIPSMEGLGLVAANSTRAPYDVLPPSGKTLGKVVVYDYGLKKGLLLPFLELGFSMRVVPYDFPFQDALAEKPVGVLLSNGPGDPAEVPEGVKQVQGLVGKVPIFAVCMGHQLLALALGGKTYKLKFGHHGVNHPVRHEPTGQVLVTSQNHGFAVKEEGFLNRDTVRTHVSLNDGTLEGFASERLKFQSVQFHPEAKPGPQDAHFLVREFFKGNIS